MSKLWTALAALIVITAGLAFTGAGHRVLHTLGFTGACSTSDGDC